MTGQPLWFTRATLNVRAPDVAPLVNTLLAGGDEGHIANTTHRLLWTLMPPALQQQEKPARESRSAITFLWCDAADRQGPPAWYVLGPRPRTDAAFFTVDCKPWSPAVAAGDRLTFEITVNATVDRMIDPAKGRAGRQRTDLVLDAITAHERAQGTAVPRAALRAKLAPDTLQGWWTAQGVKHGFTPQDVTLAGYRTVPLQRGTVRGRTPLLGIARLKGTIVVTDPVAFVNKVSTGFGRAKAFGCGLMLLKRAR